MKTSHAVLLGLGVAVVVAFTWRHLAVGLGTLAGATELSSNEFAGSVDPKIPAAIAGVGVALIAKVL